ncbi:Cold-shock DEAD box protein A [Sporosarcina pasteurii]|uniref:Cold-shock DEAD box protein A n=1 Tax=Sporosarcina pasteurii TaxID=1474 RepID=A0A380BBM7_SPOPA|nr:Cold-shock DEAD box protein A [Sporosarcina pasteurii]
MKEAKLLYNKAPIVVLHSNMRSAERQQALESFRKGKSSILIATDLAARGLDIEGLTHVIHVDVPHTIEQYLHRSGKNRTRWRGWRSIDITCASRRRRLSQTYERFTSN